MKKNHVNVLGSTLPKHNNTDKTVQTAIISGAARFVRQSKRYHFYITIATTFFALQGKKSAGTFGQELLLTIFHFDPKISSLPAM